MTTFIAPERYVTPDFILRSYHAGDGELFADAVNSSLDHLSQFLPWARTALSADEAEAQIRNKRAKYLKNDGFALGIFSPNERELWGSTGYNLWEGPLEWGNAEIGMWIRASQAGKGLGTAVLQAEIQWGFTEWLWTRLAWQNDAINIASRRAAEKAGMTYEGTHRGYFPAREDGEKGDSMVYAILKSDWSMMNGNQHAQVETSL
jgi:RimJ/RimL family protein N-acetyltransferase